VTDLWLVRHGEAVSLTADHSRPLSADGARAVSAAASAVSKEMGRPDLVATSGKLRARQTAEIFCAAVGYPEEMIGESAALAPDSSPESFFAFLEEHADKGSILCVGHLPSIALIASALLSPRDPLKLVFGPGSVCRIRLSAASRGMGELLLFRTAS
jgi:phosphohistidine phosphatase